MQVRKPPDAAAVTLAQAKVDTAADDVAMAAFQLTRHRASVGHVCLAVDNYRAASQALLAMQDMANVFFVSSGGSRV